MQQADLAGHDHYPLFARHVRNLTEHAGGELRGLCPFHADSTPSWTGNRHTGLWRCFGCGAHGNVYQFAKRVGEPIPVKERTIVATYDYTDEHGALLYQVVRYSPKAFAQPRPDGHGGWVYSLNGVPRGLYRLPEVVDKTTVYLVEGEKDVDRLCSIGLPATCNPQGAGKWRAEYSEALRGKRVVILPDNDEVGEQHALQVARSLLSVAAAVRIVRLPGLPAKGDVSDWLDAGHSKEELTEIVKAAPILRAEDLSTEQARQSNSPILIRLSGVAPCAVRWLWPGRIPLGKVTVLDGDPGLGKSLLSLDIAAQASTARPMPDGTTGDLSEPAGVVILSAEDDLSDTLRPRLEAAGADCSRIVALTAVREADATRLPALTDLEEIRQAIAQVNAKLLVVDPLMAYLPSKVDSYRDQDVRRSLAPLAALAAETGVAVLVIRHLNKTSNGNPLYRGGGSIGIIGAARSGLLVATDPEDPDGERRILVSTKSNLAKLPPALAYRIAVTAENVPFLVWEGPTNHTATALLTSQAEGEERSALEEAKEFLREVLADGPRSSKDLLKEADHAGIAERTLRRARQALGIKPVHTGQPGDKDQRWLWELPPKMAKDAEDGHQKTMATFEEDGHLREPGEREEERWEDEL